MSTLSEKSILSEESSIFVPAAPAIVTRRLLVGAAALAPFASIATARAGTVVTFPDIWNENSELPDGELDFSDQAKFLSGQQVAMRGYMAPPLKPEVKFFVLTRLPTAICPFCDAAAAWPKDIVLALMNRPMRVLDYDRLIEVSGTLQVGTTTDADTGFVSRVRLADSTY